MIQGSREEEAPTKQDVGASNDKAQTSSRAWSAFKNPRIVRMSRIGGKDRHSKVRTIRGLRDRRVRLSVPTAIQLYDLQDKLGFNQPSKVVDWLLSAAQHEIDKLPPLEMLQGNDLFQFPQSNQAYSGQTILNGDEYITPKGKAQRLASSSSSLATSIFNNNVVEDMTVLPKSISNTLDVVMRCKLEKEANLKEPSSVEKGNITEGNLKHDAGVVLENGAITYSPYYHLETPNAYSSHGQSEVPHGYLALLASYMAAAPNVDSKQYNHFQMAGSASENDPSNALRTSLHAAIPNLMVPRKNSTGSN